MKKNIFGITLAMSITLSLTGCAPGISSDGSELSTPKGTAFYVDSAVSGVTASCGATVSLTDIDGKFTYEVGESCTFLLGNIWLRDQNGITDGKMILEDNVDVAQFLQSLDNDNNKENGIEITAVVSDRLALMGITKVPETEDELIDIITQLQQAGIGFGGDFVTKEEAQNHVNQTERKIKNPEYFKQL